MTVGSSSSEPIQHGDTIMQLGKFNRATANLSCSDADWWLRQVSNRPAGAMSPPLSCARRQVAVWRDRARYCESIAPSHGTNGR